MVWLHQTSSTKPGKEGAEALAGALVNMKELKVGVEGRGAGQGEPCSEEGMDRRGPRGKEEKVREGGRDLRGWEGSGAGGRGGSAQTCRVE